MTNSEIYKFKGEIFSKMRYQNRPQWCWLLDDGNCFKILVTELLYRIENITSFCVTNIDDLQYLSPTSLVVSYSFRSRMNYHKSGGAWSWTNMSHVTWHMIHMIWNIFIQKALIKKRSKGVAGSSFHVIISSTVIYALIG